MFSDLVLHAGAACLQPIVGLLFAALIDSGLLVQSR